MTSRLLDDTQERTWAVVLDAGDEATESLESFAREQQIHSAHFTAIGAFESAVLGYFEIEKSDYRKNPVGEQVEVLSLVGNVTRYEGQPKVHAHVVVGRRDGTTLGGHLLQARVRPTLEVMLVESPTYLRRGFHPEFGIPLIDPEAGS